MTKIVQNKKTQKKKEKVRPGIKQETRKTWVLPVTIKFHFEEMPYQPRLKRSKFSLTDQKVIYQCFIREKLLALNS